jgi:predicted N-acyltransferase
MTSNYTVRVIRQIQEAGKANWDDLFGTSSRTRTEYYNPFISYNYLSSLEESGSASIDSGWLPSHVLLHDEKGSLAGAVPAYLKDNSQGEYVFDHGWADAFERAGGNYYPKLQCSVPFTPASGPRLLLREPQSVQLTQDMLAKVLVDLTDQLGISSAHVTFAPDDDIQVLTKAGFLHRTDQQFHFINQGYRDHNEFLDALSSRKRKDLRKERAAALSGGIEIDWLTGSDLTEDIWDQFFAFYMDTGSRKWGQPYLTRKFYSLIGERMAEDILLIMAKRDGRYIAGAINFIGSDALYGRHWGCIEDHPFLHFEVCYHQAIDFALAKGLSRVEAGAQGSHKLARGYMPVTTHSAHYIAHPGFRKAVSDYLIHERKEVDAVQDYLDDHSPFRKAEQ